MSRIDPDDALTFPGLDPLAALVAGETARRRDGPLWEDERFLSWLADETRDRAERRRGDIAAEGIGTARLAAVQARRHGVIVLEAAARTPAQRECPMYPLGVAAGTGRELWDDAADGRVAVPDKLPRGSYVAIRIVGESMAPLMHTGDTVLVRRGVLPAIGQIIVARHPDDGYVCKVLARMTTRRIELASLEPGRAPIIIPRESSLLVGKVEAITKGNG